MKDTLSKIVIFAAGAAIGSAVTWKIIKTKYERLAQEEIDSVIATFRGIEPMDEEDIGEVCAEPVDETPDIREYAAALQHMGYTNYSNGAEYVEREVDDVVKPYVISPDEFGEIDGYAEITLTYYADGYLTDDQDELVEDVDGTVGYKSLEHFGDYEDDAVHVRNDNLKADYEILLDVRDYADIVNCRPYPTED